jgi:hypothetical protein
MPVDQASLKKALAAPSPPGRSMRLWAKSQIRQAKIVELLKLLERPETELSTEELMQQLATHKVVIESLD